MSKQNVDLRVPGQGTYEQKLARAKRFIRQRVEHDMGVYRDAQGREHRGFANISPAMCTVVEQRRLSAVMQALNTSPINQEDRYLRSRLVEIDERRHDPHPLDDDMRYDTLDELWALHRDMRVDRLFTFTMHNPADDVTVEMMD